MEALFDWTWLADIAETAQAWLLVNVFSLALLFQLLAMAATFGAAYLIGPRLGEAVRRRDRARWIDQQVTARKFVDLVADLALPITWAILQWTLVVIAVRAGWSPYVMKVVVSLLNAWIVIRLASGLIRDPVWARLVAVIAWTVAALNILGLLDPTVALLDGLALSFGEVRISALGVIKGVLSLAVLLWVAIFASRIFEQRINALPSLTPSIQVLCGKLLKIVLITVAIVAALSSIGIDLTAFAVFSGAVGVGIGFGLQKVVSNLISGVILLLDKSIKPGDVIGIDETYGWIQSLGARYASVVTRDGVEHLIPNEDLITQRVENWSFSNNQVRRKIPVGISYNADVRKAIELCLAAADETPRVLAEPTPRCLLRNFGDSSVDLEIRIWIDDPQNGVSNVQSDLLLRVWDKFHENGIDIPFPQRDLHLKTPPTLSVVMQPAG